MISIKSKSNKMMNNVELSNQLEMEIKKIIKKARMEVLEVCSKEYNFDINAAMLLVNVGGAKRTPAKEKVAKEPKVPKGKKERAKKAVKELLEGEVEGDRKRKGGKGSKGRPKNPEKVVDVEETENLFEQLVSSQLEHPIEIDDEMCCVVFQTKEEKKAEQGVEKVERGLMSGEEKATKAVNKAGSKLEAKLEASASAIAAKEQAKMAKDAEKMAKDAEKLAAKEYKLLCQQKKAEEKLATASAIAEEKLAKATASSAIAEEKLAKAQEKKASASSKKPNASSGIAAKATELSEKLEAVPGHQLVIPVVAVVEVVATASSVVATSAPATLKVKSFKFEGATYFREKTTGAIYDKESNDHLGQWNEATQKIDFLEPEEELEEEDESAGESSDEEEEEEEA